jgi:predicted nucleotide-binding protein
MAQLRIFVSYSHTDTKQKERLLKHLTPLEAAADFDVWTDSRIKVGEKWLPAIEAALSGASVAILLITADFLGSDFVRQKEIPAMLERREKEDLRLYPILAKSCAWQAVPWIQERQIRPVAAKPVWRSGGRYVDDELARIALELLGVIQLAMQAKEAADAAARQKAEQERREKEKAIAEAVASTLPVETIYLAKKAKKPGELEKIFRDQQLTNADAAEAQKIYTQISADAAKQQLDRWTVLQDLQTKIFNITQDVTINRSRKMDDAYKRWDEYIRQA